jgi:oligopeptide transport system substrate-binding protein
MRRLATARISASLILVSLVSLACQALPAPDGAGAQGSAGQEFRFNLGGEPPGLDPQYAAWDNSISVLVQLFDALLRFDDQLRPAPGLAREVPSLANGGISADGRTYTFKLREEARWSDGQPVRAEDFVYGLRRLFDPDRGAEYASFYFDVVGAKAFFTARGTREQPRQPSESELRQLQQEIGARAIDEHTLEVQLTEPRPTFLHLAALWPMYPVRQDVVERYGDRWTEAGNLVSNGPFRLAEWAHQDRIVLVPNEHYGGTKPRLQRITFRMVTDANADFAAYLNGEVDAVRVPPANVSQVLNNDQYKAELKRAPRLVTYAYQFNVKRPPFDRKEVRLAFSQAINREVFISQVQRGVGKPAYSWIPPGMPGYREDLGKDVGKFDPAAARRLLAEAGHPNGAGLPPISFQYSNTGPNGLRAQFLQGQLKENLGVEIALEPMEPSSFSRLVNANQHQFALFGWGADYPDPDNWLPEIFGTGAGNNHTQYANPTLDELMRRAAQEPDERRRLELWGQAQEIVVRDAPLIFLVHDEAFVLIKPYVQGVKLAPLDGSLPGRESLREVWIAR